jgi:hypothetical protein
MGSLRLPAKPTRQAHAGADNVRCSDVVISMSGAFLTVRASVTADPRVLSEALFSRDISLGRTGLQCRVTRPSRFSPRADVFELLAQGRRIGDRPNIVHQL